MSTIKTLMSPKPLCLSEEDNVARVIEVLMEGGFRHIPVVDDGRLVGIVSQTDVLGWLGSSLPNLRTNAQATASSAASSFVGSVMVRDPVSLRPNARVSEAARLMLTHTISSVPVVDDHHRVVGIVTQTDLLRHALSLELTEEQNAPYHSVAPITSPEE